MDSSVEQKPETEVNEAPVPSASQDKLKKDEPETVYSLKSIKWMDLKTKQTTDVSIVLQNKNGPCPLISLSGNVLILRGDLHMRPGHESVTYETLVSLLGEYLLQHCPENVLTKAMNALPKLQTGLDVNVRFDSCFAFDWDDVVFEAFNAPVCHGWTVDPQDEETFKAITRFGTFNNIMEKVIHVQEGRGSQEEIRQLLLAQEFLEQTSSQLTYHGLHSLVERLEQNSLSVFFRNNHFSTLFKRNNNELFTLVTDLGYANQSDAVWETLNNIEGDSIFVNSDFQVASDAGTLSAKLIQQLQDQDIAEAEQKQEKAKEKKREAKRREKEQLKEKEKQVSDKCIIS